MVSEVEFDPKSKSDKNNRNRNQNRNYYLISLISILNILFLKYFLMKRLPVYKLFKIDDISTKAKCVLCKGDIEK